MAFKVLVEPDTPFTLDQPLNPCNNVLFPWLSKVATNFDMFVVRALQVSYIPACSTQTSGQLTMAFDYDPTDANDQKTPENLGSMPGSVQGQVYAPMSLVFNIRACPVTTHKFYTSASDDHSSSERFDHPARLHMCISTRQSSRIEYGSIYVDYTMDMISPQDSGPGYSNDAKVASDATTGTADDPLGTLPNQTITNNKPTTQQVAAKTKRVTRVINGVLTLIAQAAPFVGAVAKAFLTEYMPAIPGKARLYDGTIVNVDPLNIPGEVIYILSSTQARKVTVIASFYGNTGACPAPNAFPYPVLGASTNVNVTTVTTYPGSDLQAFFQQGTSYTIKVMGIWNVEYSDLTESTAWLKPVIQWSNATAMAWVPQPGAVPLNWMEVYVKTVL
jgi:hypothetical protein